MPAFPIISFQPLQLTNVINNVGAGVLNFNTSLPISTDDPNSIIVIMWWGSLQTATGTTSTTLKCFRGPSASGVLLDQWAGNTVPAATGRMPLFFAWHDIPGVQLAQQTYSFTITMLGATDNTGFIANGGCLIMAL